MKCSICATEFFPEARSIKKIKTMKKYHYAFCPHCGLGILNPSPSKKNLDKIYSAQSYFENLSAPSQNPLLQWVFTKKIYRSPSEWTIKNFKPGRILDVGCGNGEYLHDLHKKGWGTWGSDVSKVAVRRTEKRIGQVRAKTGDFLKQRFNQKFDVISFWHILEHVEDPVAYLKKAFNLLKQNGIIIGEMPNGNSAVLHKFTYCYSWYMLPDHIIYFNEKSLRHICDSAGFRRQRILYPPRALLNFSLSYKKLLQIKKIHASLQVLLFAVSIPFSLGLGVINAWFKKGEVIRFIAYKK